MIFMTRYIKLNNEFGRIPLNNINDAIFSDQAKIELHLGSNITAQEWLDLANFLPNLISVTIFNNSGEKQIKSTIETTKICNIIKRLHDLTLETNKQDDKLLLESLTKYKNAIAGILGEEQSFLNLVEVEEHINMTLDILNTSKNATQKSPAELKNYLELTDKLFANRSNKQWYIDAKHISMALVAAASLALIAGCLISSSTPVLPLMAINYMVSGNVIPIAATAIIGSFTMNHARSQAEKCSQQESLVAQSKIAGLLFFSHAKQVNDEPQYNPHFLNSEEPIIFKPSAPPAESITPPPPAYSDVEYNQTPMHA